MKETCLNCKYYCSTLNDTESDFHIHNYCRVWKTIIPSSTIFIREGCVSGYDDIECGLATCWAFLPTDSAFVYYDFFDMALNER